MLRNHFDSHVPSDLLLLEDALQIKKNILVYWQYATLNVFIIYLQQCDDYWFDFNSIHLIVALSNLYFSKKLA
jgi:hypothetical protein